MPTVVLDAYSKAYPLITNRIRASVFLETDPAALIATIIDSTAGHPARIWHFPGLPRANYGFSLDEINGGGAVVNNLALFSVVPSQITGYLVRDDEQIKVGTTPGFDAGLQSVFFDGGETSPGSGIFRPDYRGWIIVPSELTGRGILVKDVLDYTWDPITGEMVWSQAGDILQSGTFYNIHFNPLINSAGGSVPTVLDFSTRIVTETGNIEVTDFGNNIIIEPDGVYLELTLPDITTVPQGRLLTIETKKAIGTAVQCSKILPLGADIINFLSGNLYMMNNESLQIYRLKREDESNEWRVRCADGNFKTVGQSVGDDCIQSGVYCKQLLNGAIGDINQHARIYNEIVLNLPASQVVDYDVWAVGTLNKYFFSKANSSDPGNAGKFHFPDRRGVYERNNSNAGKAGDYSDDQIKISPLFITINQGNSYTGNGGPGIVGRGSNSPNSFNVSVQGSVGTGTETHPKEYLINKYCLI